MAISDKSWAEHAKWLAFERNRFSWPKHWQVVIFKIHRDRSPMRATDTYRVLPANPDYQAYLSKCESEIFNGEYPPPPPMHLGPVEFDSMEDIDQWAAVAHRLR